MTLGTSLFNLGDQAGGIEELKKAESLEPTPHQVGTLGYYFARAGRKDEARKALADLEDMSKHRFVPAYWLAAVHIGLGENNEAFTLLERSYQERSWWLIFLKMDPIMESLHADPRYSDLLHKIGYPN
jgi:Flp pilus assembly protein TadD